MNDLIRELLLHQANDPFRGPNGNYAAVLEALDGVTATQAAWKPAPNRNAMWQIIDHLSGTKEWAIRAMATGDPGPSPKWRECTGDEQAWAAEKQRLIERHERLVAALAAAPDADLVARVPGLGLTQFELALSIACAHEAYHAGQLQYLKLVAVDMGIR